MTDEFVWLQSITHFIGRKGVDVAISSIELSPGI
jgi:hypothetical protein